MPRYMAFHYEGEGGAPPPSDVSAPLGPFLTLEEAQVAVIREIGANHGWWLPDDAVEAWHESAAAGCGGWEIKLASKDGPPP
jgi:hypothetical protein